MDKTIIKHQLMADLSQFIHWEDISNNSSPNHYGHESWGVDVSAKDFKVNFEYLTIRFRNTEFSGVVLFGGSGSDAATISFRKKFSGLIYFDFDSGNNAFIKEILFDDKHLNLIK